MLLILVSIISSLALYERAPTGAFFLAPGIFFVTALATFTYKSPGEAKIFFIGLALTLLSLLRIFYVISQPDSAPENFQNETGTVINLREWGRNYVAVIKTERHGNLVTRLHFAELMEGTRINFDGSTRAFKKNNNSSFNEKYYWKARDVSAWVSLKNIRELPERFSLARLRYKISRELAIKLPALTRDYLRAAWLGERSKDLNDRHRQWGTSHLLAVSGFHVGLVILLAKIFLGDRNFLISIILWLYVLLTGAAPSAMRAALMLQTGLLANIFERRANGVNSVCAAAVMLLLYRPFLFWDIGWRLSVLAALTITALLGNLNIKKFFAYSLLVGPCVFLTTYPQIEQTFNNVPLVGIILNLFAPFYFSFAFMISSLIALLKLIGFPFMNLFVSSAEGIFILWEKFAALLAGAVNVNVENYFFIFFPLSWIGTGLLIFLLCRYLRLPAVRTVILVTGFSAAGFVMFYSKSTLKVINPSASFHSAPPLTQGRQGVDGIKDVEELSCAPPSL